MRYSGLSGAILLCCALGGCGTGRNVPTQHNDNFRTGATLTEKTLTPALVRARGMRLKYWVSPCNGFNSSRCIDGGLTNQPLYVDNVAFRTGRAQGLFLATQNNVVYALKADTGDREWSTPLQDADQRLNLPRGVNATPAIDVAANRMYVLFSTRRQLADRVVCVDVNGKPLSKAACDLLKYRNENASVNYWVSALNIRTGDELARTGVSASVLRSDGTRLSFDGRNQLDHAALLLDKGSLYIAFASVAGVEGSVDYHGWVIRYRASDLSRQSVFCTSPNPATQGSNCPGVNTAAKSLGSGIWQGGGGAVADDAGSIYFLTGNGRADFGPHILPNGIFRNHLFGDSLLKLTLTGVALHPTAFAPANADCLESTDADLGSGGPMIIPNSNLVIGGGKSGVMYVLDRTSMQPLQQFNASTNQYNPALRDQTWDDGPHLHGSPTYWRGPDKTFGFLYIWGEKDFLRMYRFDTRTQQFEESRSGPILLGVRTFRHATVKALPDTMPGGMLSLSANGNKAGTGIVWATLPDSDCTPGAPCPKPPSPPFPGRLYAFDAETLKYLWDYGYGILGHWVPPTIADGLVFISGGDGSINTFELGSESGVDRGKPEPNQPHQVTPQGCGGCHTEMQQRELLAKLQPLNVRYSDEASIRAWPNYSMKDVAAPRQHVRSIMLEGNGIATYKAVDDAAAARGLSWRLNGSTGNLREIRVPGLIESRAPLQVRLSGNVWSAPDGSSIAGEVERITAAPDSADADWVLFRTKGSGVQGKLSDITYVQRVYTHAGQPPVPATARGAHLEIPFHAQYWMYR